MDQTAQLHNEVSELLRDGVPEVEVLLVERASPGLLRVFVDRAGGVDLELCERVTRALSPLRERFALEVSSPGIERPLVRPEHFRRALGSPVAVRTVQPVAGRRHFRGTLTSVGDEAIGIDQDGQPVSLPLAAIRRAHLVVEQLGGTR